MTSIRSLFLVGISFLSLQTALFADWTTPPLDVNAAQLTDGPALSLSNFNGDSIGLWRDAFTGDAQSGILPYDTSAWVILTGPTGSANGTSESRKVVVDNLGNATAVWTGGNLIRGARLAQGSTSWTAPTNLSTSNTFQSNVSAAVDSLGNVIAVWAQGSSSLSEVYAARYDAGLNTWSSVLIDSGNTYASVSVDVDSIGNAVMVYDQTNSPNVTVRWSSYNVVTDTWSTSDNIFPLSSNYVEKPQVGCNNAGDFTAIWLVDTGVTGALRSAKLDAGGSTWTPADANIVNLFVSTPQLAVDRLTGDAMAIWYVQFLHTIQYSKISSGSNTWSSPLDVSNDNASSMLLKMDSNGNAVGFWIDAVNFLARTASYSKATDSWGTVTTLSNASANPVNTSLAVNASGNAIAGWITTTYHVNTSSLNGQITSPSLSSVVANPLTVQADGISDSTITVTLRDSANAPIQGHTVSLAAGSGSSIISPLSGVSDGSGVVTFTVTDTTVENVTYTATDTTDSLNPIQITQTATVGFTALVANAANSTVVALPTSVQADGVATSTITVTLLNNNNVAVAGHTVSLTAGSGSSIISAPSGVSNSSGEVTFTVTDTEKESIVYSATDTADNIILNQTAQVEFYRDEPESPVTFGGSVKRNQYGVQTEIMNVLTWGPSPDPITVGYRIYSKGVLVYEGGTQGPFRVVLHNRQKSESYTLVAVGSNNLESSPLSLNLN